MAPRKRKGGAAAPGGEEKLPTVTITTTATATATATVVAASTAVSRRVTRSSARGVSAGGPGADSVPEPPVAKKAKGVGRKKKKKAAKEEENDADGEAAGEADGGDGEDVAEKGVQDGELEKVGARGALDAKAKTVVIEHCKQCNSFKTRAIQVKNGLEKGVPGIIVVVNPDKPRRGCFEIREQGGEKFISLLDMKRPFGPMKALDMDKVILDIINKVKA